MCYHVNVKEGREVKQKAATKKRPRGRPARTDNPMRLTVLLPGELRLWLRIHAAETERDMGDIVTDALGAYRAGRKARRRQK
jgi:hypothetical protein